MAVKMIALVAKQPLSYAGRDLRAGDVFEAKPIDAAVLTYKRRAGFAPKDATPTPEPEPEPAPGTRRRRYRTRELKADE